VVVDGSTDRQCRLAFMGFQGACARSIPRASEQRQAVRAMPGAKAARGRFLVLPGDDILVPPLC